MSADVLVHDLLHETARVRPGATALVVGHERVSYAQLDALTSAYGAALHDSGVRPGDRVVLLLENSVELVAGIFGTLAAGAVFTVVSPATKPQKLAFVLGETRAAVVLSTHREALAAALALMPRERRPRAALGIADGCWERLLVTASPAPAGAREADDLACIIWTSGTTGRPKGVMSCHRDMVFATQAIASYLGNGSDDVIFCSLYLGHSYGLYQLLTSVAVGAALVLERGFAFPHAALALMARERVTGLAGVPTMFSVLVGLEGISRHDLSSLRYVTNAAAPLPSSTRDRLQRLLPAAAFFSMYGQTECKRVCYLPSDEADARPGSVGRPLPGTAAFVVDADGRPSPPGVVGELVVQGPHLMSGYWNQPVETSQRLRSWPGSGERTLYTGDLFRADADGYLYFVSRADDIIKCRGEKVAPAEVEEAVRGLPGVVDVVAVGVPDDVLGEAVKVFVVAEPGRPLSVEDLRVHCLRQLEPHQVPSHVEFCSELPRSDTGKVLRRKLRTCAA